jgi:hypothetical protein
MKTLNFVIPNAILTQILTAMNFSEDGDEIGGGELVTIGYNGEELYLYVKLHNNTELNINIRSL